MLVASVSRSASTATLEIFRFPVTNDNLHPTSMINLKVATLGLPFVDDGYRIARVDIYPLFVKNFVIHKHRLLYNTSIDAKPFVNTKSDNILLLYLNVEGKYGYDNISFIVHSSALLRLTPHNHSHGSMLDVVPWELWGPSVTRWFEGGIVAGEGTVTCGYRCLVRPQDFPAQWELWDFNPYRVRSLGNGFTEDNETSRLTVETEPSCARSHGIMQGIYSSLPFVKHFPKQWDYTYVGLSDDKVVGKKVSNYFNFSILLTLVQQPLRDGRYLIENLYFA
jgi:hypothetical protein